MNKIRRGNHPVTQHIVNKAIKDLQFCYQNLDTEMGHIEADKIIVNFLKDVGFEEVSEEYDRIKKWYS